MAEKRKNVKKRLLLWGIAGLLLLVAIAVGVSLLLPSADVRFNVSPQSLTMTVGQTEQLTLVNQTGNGEILQAVWSSNSPKVVSVDQEGCVTAVAAGKAKITAVVVHDGKEYAASANITVTGNGQDQLMMEGAAVTELEHNFILSQKASNVTDTPSQGIITVSDSASNSYMVFAAGKGTGLYADSWELTGTITKEILDVPLFVSFGVIDEAGKEQWFCILDDCLSLQRYWNWWDTQYECDGDHVILNQVAEDFFYASADANYRKSCRQYAIA